MGSRTGTSGAGVTWHRGESVKVKMAAEGGWGGIRKGGWGVIYVGCGCTSLLGGLQGGGIGWREGTKNRRWYVLVPEIYRTDGTADWSQQYRGWSRKPGPGNSTGDEGDRLILHPMIRRIQHCCNRRAKPKLRCSGSVLTCLTVVLSLDATEFWGRPCQIQTWIGGGIDGVSLYATSPQMTPQSLSMSSRMLVSAPAGPNFWWQEASTPTSWVQKIWRGTRISLCY